MKLQDALNLLGLEGQDITLSMCKVMYRRACMRYHPDRSGSSNAADVEMMKAVNAAWAACQAWDWSKGDPVNVKPSKNRRYADELYAAIKAVVGLEGISLEVCGAWLWVSGNTKPHKEVFKKAGFFWASKKMQWYFRTPEYQSHNRGDWSMEKIREFHGSEKIDPEKNKSQGRVKQGNY